MDPATVRWETEPTPPPATNRRRGERHPCWLDRLAYLTAGKDRLRAQVHNLSAGGLCLILFRRFEPGDRLSVRIYNLGRTYFVDVEIRVRYSIVRPRGDVVMGAEFTRLLSDGELLGLLDDNQPAGA